MATLLDALNQENLDNQRDVVKNEKRSSYDNRPYGQWFHKLQEQLFPPEHRTIIRRSGRMEDLDAASLRGRGRFLPDLLRAEQRVLAIAGDADPAQARAWVERYFGEIAANPRIPPLGDVSLPPTLGAESREVIEDRVPLPRHYFGFRAPCFGDPRLRPWRSRADTGRRKGQPGVPSARARRTDRPGRRVLCPRVRRWGIDRSRPGDGSAGVDPEVVRARLRGGARTAWSEPVTADELARARALIETFELEALQRV